MIYEPVVSTDPICQGDIFYDLPFVRFNLEKLKIISDNDIVQETSWNEITENNITMLANLEKTYAIILSQDCDCLRNPYLSLLVINPWNKSYTSDKKWMEEIIKINNSSPSKMYLPPDEEFNIHVRMLIDISRIFAIRRVDLEQMKNLRICKLNTEAMEHFREKVAYYFHRYAYDEHYPFNTQEMNKYEEKREETFSRREYQREED